MSKTILERMCAISDKMREIEGERDPRLEISTENLTKVRSDLAALRRVLGMNTMQVLIMTATLLNAYRRRIGGDDLAACLGMDYLKFLTYGDDLEELKRRGYIRINRDGEIALPPEVLKSLKENRPVEPEQTEGLDTMRILSILRRKLSLREDDQLTTDDVREDIDHIMKVNQQTSIGRTYCKYMQGKIGKNERLVFAVMLHRYYNEDDDMIGWHNMNDYFDEEDLSDLRLYYSNDNLDLQKEKIIEYTGVDGMLTKDYFKIRDEIKEEAFADVGGVRKTAANVSASRKIEAGSIHTKELFYNPAEQRQVDQLRELMSDERFNGIRSKMKEKGLRTGFSCIFYGSPGTGKTETVYQIARASGRDIFVIDVSQVKSKWVGDSEKNIKEVFVRYRECVAKGGVVPILLFNEADAIFSRRFENPNHSADQMCNSMQNIILQEMEDLDGILIATTNLTSNLDKAFERRFLYKIRFEKPSVEARSHIWKSMIPELSETESLQLAEDFDFSGGQIENIARKKTVKGLISGQDPTYADIREYCGEETIGEGREYRKIGF